MLEEKRYLIEPRVATHNFNKVVKGCDELKFLLVEVGALLSDFIQALALRFVKFSRFEKAFS